MLGIHDVSRCSGATNHRPISALSLAIAAVLLSAPVSAQDGRQWFVGGLAGISALSADARTETSESRAAVSLYDPKNGPAVNLFAGAHLAEYLSVQANWMWNRNDLTLFSAVAGASGGGFAERRLHSRQDAFVADALVYFRRRDSVIRPYLGTGLFIVRVSMEAAAAAGSNSVESLGDPADTRLGLRSHVGIDVALSRHVAFRYSFSETISGNPFSESLVPPGRRGLMNFQNLFGIVGRF